MHTVRVHLAIPYGYPSVHASQAQASQWHLGDVVYSKFELSMAFTNNWSNSSQCNHTFSVINVEHRAEVIALVSFEFFSAFLCISFVILLTIRVKKKLWDTAAKRFHLGLTICSILCFLNEGSLLLVYLGPNYQLSITSGTLGIAL